MAPSSVLLECLPQAAIKQVIGPFTTPSKILTTRILVYLSLSRHRTPSYPIFSPDPAPHCPSNQNLSHTRYPTRMAGTRRLTLPRFNTRRQRDVSNSQAARYAFSHVVCAQGNRTKRTGVVLTKCAIFPGSN